jgi:hypothetical protein
VRSINPLLGKFDVLSLLQTYANHSSNFSPTFGWGVPNVGATAASVIGNASGVRLQNRLTPMFEMYYAPSGDRLYSIVPQVMTAAATGFFLVRPYCVYQTVLSSHYCDAPQNRSDPLEQLQSYVEPSLAEASYVKMPDQQFSTTGQPITDGIYRYPGLNVSATVSQARSPFSVFTTSKNPYGGQDLVPLIRLSIAESCLVRGSAYVTSESAADGWESTDMCPGESGVQSYHRDGREGYILASCPSQFGTCTNYADATAPQGLYLRYSATTKNYALVLASHLSDSTFATFIDANGGNPLGYAFPNIDSDQDGIIDGFERLIGTSPNRIDSDCNGLSDTAQFPMTKAQPAGADPMSPTSSCGPGLSVTLAASVTTNNLPTQRVISYTTTIANQSGKDTAVPVTLSFAWGTGSGEGAATSVVQLSGPTCTSLTTTGCTVPTLAGGGQATMVFSATFGPATSKTGKVVFSAAAPAAQRPLPTSAGASWKP